MPYQQPIGKRRWRLQIFERSQLPDPTSAGIVETPVALATVWADVQPLGAETFYNALISQGGDSPTHRITMRWVDWLDLKHAFVRQTTRPDGTERTEVYRIRRTLGDQDGRKRFSVAECQLEQSI